MRASATKSNTRTLLTWPYGSRSDQRTTNSCSCARSPTVPAAQRPERLEVIGLRGEPGALRRGHPARPPGRVVVQAQRRCGPGQLAPVLPHRVAQLEPGGTDRADHAARPRPARCRTTPARGTRPGATTTMVDVPSRCAFGPDSSHVDAGLLQVVGDDGVVDVPLGVQVHPAQRDAAEVPVTRRRRARRRTATPRRRRTAR